MATPLLATDVVGDGPAVLLLHGQPGSGTDWDAVICQLRDDCTVVTVDRPGYGRTAAAAAGFEANAAAAVATLERLGIDRAVLVGHSWGGGVALAAAERHPEQVNGVVLVSSIAPGIAPRLLDRVLAAPVVGDVMAASTFAAAGTLLASASVRAGLDRMLPGAARAAFAVAGGAVKAGPDVDASPAGQIAHRRPWVWGRDALWRSFTVEQRAFVDEIESLGPDLDRIQVPCSVVVGTSDHIVDPAVGIRLAESIAGAELRQVADAGHMLPFDHPREVADAVRAVVARANT